MATLANARSACAIQGPDDFAAAFGVSRETMDRLATYETLLRQWQKTINLVAPSTLDAVWHRHFADSAQLLALAPRPAPGSTLAPAPAFPGLVVAILLAEGHLPLRGGAAHAGRLAARANRRSATGQVARLRRVTLIESDTRKRAFLREVSPAQTGIAVDILSTRIEICATQS